jgi:hypothetical protein
VTAPDGEQVPSRLTALRTSARGWHGVQLAVIGFIGLCGVLQGGRPDNPVWLQVWAGLLAITALVLACIATYLVARVAWPLYGARDAPEADETATLERESSRIRRGLALTFLAVAVLALGTATGWWPQEEAAAGGGGGLVEVQAANGQSVCGSLDSADPGNIAVSVNGEPVVVPLRNVAAVAPADSC